MNRIIHLTQKRRNFRYFWQIGCPYSAFLNFLVNLL